MAADTPAAHGPPLPDYKALARLFSTLSLQLRLRMVLLLAAGERSVNALANELGVRQPSVSHNLGLLRAARVVEARRDGRQVLYRLREPCRGDGSPAFDVGEYRVRFAVGRR